VEVDNVNLSLLLGQKISGTIFAVGTLDGLRFVVFLDVLREMTVDLLFAVDTG